MMVVDAEGRFITARRFPKLVLVGININNTKIAELSAPGMTAIRFRILEHGAATTVGIWNDTCQAIDQVDAAGQFFSTYLSEENLRLVCLDPTYDRRVTSTLSEEGDVVSFADGMAYLLASQESLDEVSANIFNEEHVDIRRFRPNIVVEGSGLSFDEDYWKTIKIGKTIFRCLKVCELCKLTTVDPDEGKIKSDHVLKSLRTHRNLKPNAGFFGMNLACSDIGAQIKVGDVVEVLEWHDEIMFK